MSYELVTATEFLEWDEDPVVVCLTYDGWGSVREIAEAYGWEPMGTEASYDRYEEEDQDWSGVYWANNAQVVTSDDAASMAGALEMALEDADGLKRLSVRITQQVPVDDAGFGDLAMIVSEYDPSVWREILEDVIALCRKGGFQIH